MQRQSDKFDSRRLRPAASLSVILVGLWIFVDSASAQAIRTRTLSDDGLRAVLEFEVDWSESLKMSVDSSGIMVWDGAAFARFTAGFEQISKPLRLGSLRYPRISTLERDFDEVRVTVTNDPSARKAPQMQVEAVGLGMYRKEPTVAVSVPLYELESETGILRRFRRIRVAITRDSPVSDGDYGGVNTSNPHVLIDRSALSDGIIFKIGITEEGIFRVDRSLLSSLGLDPDTIEPDELHLYGNGGAPVPARNSEFRYADLVENPVFVRGGGDGRFDEADVLLFYAAGPGGWTYDLGNWEHYVHPFSNENYYFLKIGSDDGIRVGTVPDFDAPAATTVTSTMGRHFTDIEEQVWSREHGSGHDWMSQTIRSGGSREILSDLTLPGLLGPTATYRARVAIASNPRATVAFESDGLLLAQRTAPSITFEDAVSATASPAETSFTQSISAGQPLNVTMRLLNQTGEPRAALDWIRVLYEQDLIADNGYLRFSSDPRITGEQRYQMRGFSATPMVWDVTRAGSTGGLEVTGGAGLFSFRHLSQSDSQPREFVAFTEAAARSIPTEAVTSVPNQNLHGIAFFPDLVIVAPAELSSAARRLADHRRAEGLEVQVAIRDEMYNEFSGGLPDMRALRDYMKFLYDRAPDEESLLRYALFLGDGHYDFRGLSSLEQQQNNWIFPYETEESLHPDASFTSDDYFGLLDDNEGEWRYTTFVAVSDEKVDIGIGRLPAQSLAEAEMMVDKIIRYEDPLTFGPWRSNYLAVADDGPNGLLNTQDDADLHLQNVDQVAELLRVGLYPINVRKVYAESFERVFLNGFRIPEARKEIKARLNAGMLVFNYSGHGGPDGLAQERIFTKEDAEALTNEDKLAVFITATCSFGWWDLEDRQSGAEALLLNENGGAVALMTTVRLVYTSSSTTSLNAGLNRALNQELFLGDEEGRPRRLGDVMRSTKNTRVGLQGNSRKFNLLGDPSMRFGIPAGIARVEKLNDMDLENSTAQMKALDRVDITGSITRTDGSVDTGFNGMVSVTVFDAVRQVPLVKQRVMPVPYYNIREDLIWRGDVTAQSGRFTASFVVPKDISYSHNPGRIYAYASSTERDAAGFSENFTVGGTSENPPNDNTGPEINLFLNDTTFVSGNTVPADPELIVRLFDESGINTIGAGVGHEMLLVVDGDESGARDISDGFVAERNSFQRGEAAWPLSVDEPGPHSLSVRAWDVINNSNTVEISFSIANDEVLSVSNVYNYPNPMNRDTRFVFEHNQPSGTPARVQIRIYTLNGRPIRTIDTEEALPEGILTGGSVQINWDGRDDDFDRLATGIYLYKLRVEAERSDGTSQVSEHIEKLAVIR